MPRQHQRPRPAPWRRRSSPKSSARSATNRFRWGVSSAASAVRPCRLQRLLRQPRLCPCSSLWRRLGRLRPWPLRPRTLWFHRNPWRRRPHHLWPGPWLPLRGPCRRLRPRRLPGRFRLRPWPLRSHAPRFLPNLWHRRPHRLWPAHRLRRRSRSPFPLHRPWLLRVPLQRRVP